jgi:hypothetical protein
MTSTYSDAPDLAGSWGVGNVIPLDLHPNFTTHHRDRNQAAFTTIPAIEPSVDLRAVLELVRAVDRRLEGQPTPVRLFVGNDAITRARNWAERHGQGSALAMPDGLDPKIVPWPPVRVLAVVPCEYPLPYHLAAGVAAALRRDGVGYAAIPHQPDWPNLWPWPEAIAP